MEHLPVNFALLRHPINWVIIFFMILIPMIAIDLLCQYHKVKTIQIS